MEELRVTGNAKLSGDLHLYGAKNAVLPIMVAALLLEGTVVLHNVPLLTDVDSMCRILELFNCKVKRENNTIIINSENAANALIPDELMKKLRASNLVWGPLIGRFGKAIVPLPGGCLIGSRPMDYHIKGMRQLGIAVEEKGGHIISFAQDLRGENIYFDFPSVGATENLIMAAVKARGTTIIRNVAREPEVVDLCLFLNKAGACIRGIGSDTLIIDGVKTFHDVEYTVIPDRIVGGTVLLAAAMTSGDVTITNAIPEHMEPLLAKMEESGVEVQRKGNALRVQGEHRIRPLDIKTLPHPGFPTDIQPQFMAMLTKANGTSVICESIFESRFGHCDELRRMGADIRVEGRLAIVKGVKRLEGTTVQAEDLRGGAALLIAGLMADGETIVRHAEHIDRGYWQVENMFNNLGADIERRTICDCQPTTA